MKMMRTIAAASIVAWALMSAPASASHITVFAPIDNIDHVFGAGGGVFAATTTGASDDAWLVFAANAGDLLTISGAGLFGPNVVLFRSGTNGVVEVGDIYTATGAFNGNSLQIGTGIDLIVQDFNFRPCGDCYVSPGSDTFLVTLGGQYVIGISPANESASFSGTTTITLSGNTANVSSAPEPAILLLMGSALGGAAYRRRRRV